MTEAAKIKAKKVLELWHQGVPLREIATRLRCQMKFVYKVCG